MEWHIITGSKGGVGKTLLSLLLLANFIEPEKRQKGSTLILDLNGMNTDSSALVLYRNTYGQELTTVELKTDVELYHQGAKSIQLQTTQADDSKTSAQTYVVGYPANPFVLMNPQLFIDLLKSITSNTDEIEKKLKIEPLRYVIVDTNYHFCNIFAQDSAYYQDYIQETLQGEEINIWFLWVYRQLEKLLDNTNEANTIRTTAAVIEQNIKGSLCQGQKKPTPLRHVFTPASLITSPEQESGIFQKIFSPRQSEKYYVVPQFKKLEDLEKGTCVDFNTWISHLNQAYNSVSKQRNEEYAVLFCQVLVEAVNRLSSNQRPENVIPLSIHENTLHHYTDKERPNAVADLRKLKIYEHLTKLL